MRVRRPSPLDLVNLPSLMALTSGRPEIRIGLVDGPIALNHPDLTTQNIHFVGERTSSTRARVNSDACRHGTFVAGILAAKRTSAAPAICPQCTLLMRPIFPDAARQDGQAPIADPAELAKAILECIGAGARILNLSVSLGHTSRTGEREVEAALDEAARRGVLVIAASGNEGSVGGSTITRHSGTVPIVAYDSLARPISQSNLGASIGRRGLGAPGEQVTSLGAEGHSAIFGGTSAAAPFVAGAVALLWSLFPSALAARIRTAITRTSGQRRASVVPPLLDAWNAYQFMKAA